MTHWMCGGTERRGIGTAVSGCNVIRMTVPFLRNSTVECVQQSDTGVRHNTSSQQACTP